VAPTAVPTAAPAATGKFQEAPMLAELVKAGKLPPVNQRLPQNPRVIKPVEKVGKYGGTWRRAYKGLSDRWGPTKLIEEFFIQWDWTDKGATLAPNLCEKWEQNANATEFTFYLRKGIKWSDGEEYNTDDIKFWYEDVFQNKDLTPTIDSNLKSPDGTPLKVTIIDKYTFKLIFTAPKPLLPINVARNGMGNPAGGPTISWPEHYMKKFHPKYTPQAELDALAKKNNVQTWDQLWGDKGDMQGPIAFWFKNPDLPVVIAWKVKVSPLTSQQQFVMERNPYYWKVDPEGNQLPYIDTITHDFFDNQEVFNLWIVSGKIDMQYRHTDTGSYTLYKENEKKGDYRVLRWRMASTNCVHLNINCPDPVLAKIMDTPKFRQALSIAIDRKQLNDLLFSGLYTPRQASPVKGSPNYDPEFEARWTEYDPKTANALLDELGLKMGPDGKTRLRPDGKALEITIESMSAPGSLGLDECQQVARMWTAVGVKTSVKQVERSLYEQHCHDGALDAGYTDWGFNRNAIVMADPGRYTGITDDGPWAPLYAHWYYKAPYKQVEPPVDHPIRKIWDLWDKTQVEPDEAKRNALFKQLLDIHKEQPWNIGTCGENPTLWIVKNNFRNVPEGRINDDPLRDEGLGMPCQYYFEK